MHRRRLFSPFRRKKRKPYGVQKLRWERVWALGEGVTSGICVKYNHARDGKTDKKRREKEKEKGKKEKKEKGRI